MPEASIHKHACPVFQQHQVRVSRQSRGVQPVAESPTHSQRLTISSGFVSFEWIAAMLADRRACSRLCSAESLSILFQCLNQFIYRATHTIKKSEISKRYNL